MEGDFLFPFNNGTCLETCAKPKQASTGLIIHLGLPAILFSCFLVSYVHALTYIKIVLIAGLPLDQKVVQYGPFVLNTQEEVYQALMDYQTHSNGFERAEGWESKIGKSMRH
jgi:hypothetical protein